MQLHYPYEVGKSGRTAETTEEAHIRDLIEQILFTAPSERVNRPTFGTGINQLLFAPNSDELATATKFLAQSALQRWLGDLIITESIDITTVESTLRVTVTYMIRRNQNRRVTVFNRGL